jgi:hypothetical protein
MRTPHAMVTEIYNYRLVFIAGIPLTLLIQIIIRISLACKKESKFISVLKNYDVKTQTNREIGVNLQSALS